MAATHWASLIENAISNIPDAYYGEYPAEWITENIPESNKASWKAILSQYNERDWCYELYHQLRSLLDSEGSTQAELSEGVRLSGESGKSSTYDGITAGCRWSKNERCRIPDILLHDPLNRGSQVFAIEVKRAGLSSVSMDNMADDLVALVEYTEGLSFACGFFIGLGIKYDQLKEAVLKFQRIMDAQKDSRDSERMRDKIYVCLVNDNQHKPNCGSRHKGFRSIESFLSDGKDASQC